MHAKRFLQVYEAILLVGGEVMGLPAAPFEGHQLLSPSQIADLRLAVAKMTGANRRAFEAEMTMKYCKLRIDTLNRKLLENQW
jgi:hypothetical protein